jgi:hypothetical protein
MNTKKALNKLYNNVCMKCIHESVDTPCPLYTLVFENDNAGISSTGLDDLFAISDCWCESTEICDMFIKKDIDL